jgi:hypothetical protein
LRYLAETASFMGNRKRGKLGANQCLVGFRSNYYDITAWSIKISTFVVPQASSPFTNSLVFFLSVGRAADVFLKTWIC